MQTYQYPAEYINKLRSTFYLMVGLPLPVFLYVYFNVRNGSYQSFFNGHIAAWFFWALGVTCLLLSLVAYGRYSKELKQIRETKAPIPHQLESLIVASRHKYLWLELATVVCVLVYVLTGHIVFAGLYVVMLILFAMSNPSVHSVSTDLRLSKEERRRLINNHPFT